MTTPWTQYQNAIGVAENPVSTSRYEATSSAQGKTGFVDLVPQRPDIQARYDAMAPEWEGVVPSDKAVIQGLFSSSPAELDKTLPTKQ